MPEIYLFLYIYTITIRRRRPKLIKFPIATTKVGTQNGDNTFVRIGITTTHESLLVENHGTWYKPYGVPLFPYDYYVSIMLKIGCRLTSEVLDKIMNVFCFGLILRPDICSRSNILVVTMLSPRGVGVLRLKEVLGMCRVIRVPRNFGKSMCHFYLYSYFSIPESEILWSPWGWW